MGQSPIYPLWDALDRLMLEGLGRWWVDGWPGAWLPPWESDDPAVQSVWEQLTRPENLTALLDWGRDLESFNEMAFTSTAMAIETCRLRSGGSGRSRTVKDCTPDAIEACRVKYGSFDPERWGPSSGGN